MARQLDRSRPFAEVIGVGYHHVYEQDGKCFDRAGNECEHKETGIGLDAAERNAANRAQAILANAQKNAQDIMGDAVAQAKAQADEILAQVKAQAEEILAAARGAAAPAAGDASEPAAEIKKAAGGKK